MPTVNLTYFHTILLDMLKIIDKPTVVTEDILYENELILNYFNYTHEKLDFRQLLIELMGHYTGIITFTYCKTEDDLEMWLVVPETYLNASKLNVTINNKLQEYTGKLIGKNGVNAKRIISVVNTIKENKYASTNRIIFNQRKKETYVERNY